MAKTIKLSATRINTFLRCKQKYWFMYEDKLPKVSNPAFRLGIACHEALEFAGKIWMEKGKFSKEDEKRILEKYNEVSVREGIEEYESHTEGRNLVKKKLKNFMTGDKVLGLELTFGFGRGSKVVKTNEGVPLIGAIDKVEEVDTDTLLIVDYKTSKTNPTPDQLKSDLQLSIYDYVASKLYPDHKRIILALDMLKDELLYTYRTKDERAEFEEYLNEVHKQMTDLKAGDVKASLNMFCPWCDYKDYCSEYKKACEKTNYDFLPVMQYDDQQLLEEWKSVRDTKRILETRERELGMVIMEKIKDNAENLAGDEEEIYIRQNSRTTYDPNIVFNLIPPEDLHKVVTLNKKAVEEYIDDNPSIKKDVLRASTTNYTSPFLATKKSKKN